MFGKPRKLAVLILASILLLTGLGGAFGFVACDQGCLGSVHHANHHVGEESHEPKPLPYYPLSDEQGDTCCDYPIRFGDTLVEEDVTPDPYFTPESLPSDLFSSLTVCLHQHDNHSRQHDARLPLKLLFHRTTVLLI